MRFNSFASLIPGFSFNRWRESLVFLADKRKSSERVSPTEPGELSLRITAKLVNSSENCQVLRDSNERRIERGTKTARLSRGQLGDSSATMRQPSSSETGPDAFWRGQKSRNRSIRYERIVFSDATPRSRHLPPPLAVDLPPPAEDN